MKRTIARRARRAALALIACSLALSSHAATVYFAGFAYSGDSASIQTRFPHTRAVEAEWKSVPANAPASMLRRMLEQSPPKNFQVEASALADLANNDQAIVSALVMTNETVSTEKIGDGYKLLVNLRAQALFFDYKSMTVLRAYPISVALLDVLDHAPTDAESDERVKQLLAGGSQPGLLQRYVQRLDEARLPDTVTRSVQVSKVDIADGVRSLLPAALAAKAGAEETWVADTFAEALSSQTGIPVLPYAKGYAIGNAMAMRFADGSVFSLRIPEPDYAISVDVTGLKRVPFGQSAAGSSFIYASYVRMKMEEPLAGQVYLDTALKNGETKAVPIAQQATDDAPAYEDSLRGLFTRTASALGSTDSRWLKVAAGASDIDKQISDSRRIIQQCK